LKKKDFELIKKNKNGKMKNNDNILDFDLVLEEVYKFKEDSKKIKKNTKINNNIKENSPKKAIKQKVKDINIKRRVDSEKISPIKNKKSSGNKTNLYDIDNFIVHSTNSKVLDRQESLQIFVPKFKELDRDYWHNNSNEILLIKNELEEDISDDIYNSFHNEFERREIEYRINLNKKER